MGDMTIRGLNEATLATLRSRAEEQGLTPESYAASLIERALNPESHDRLAVSRAILATQHEFSPISSVELLRQIREEGE